MHVHVYGYRVHNSDHMIGVSALCSEYGMYVCVWVAFMEMFLNEMCSVWGKENDIKYCFRCTSINDQPIGYRAYICIQSYT